MKRDRLLSLCSRYAYFDLPFLLQMSGENRASLNLSIKRWLADGTLLPLRRGMYTLAEHLRKAEISLPRLANDLYPGSYLTGAWALSFHGLIPDVAREYTSATQRRPQSFRNAFGVFSYRRLGPTYFWGYGTVRTKDGDFCCASPEKSLVDYWYWTRGEWTRARMMELRLQNFERLDPKTLERTVQRTAKPRITRAYRVFKRSRIREGA
jgi:hypothetical protein